MRKIIFLSLTILLFSSLAAQDLKKVQKRYFPNPVDLKINTPIASKRSGYTSFKEMKSFLTNLQAENSSIMQLEEVGKTQKGREILLVKLSNNIADTAKMRVLYFARIHGDEPGGTEGLLHFIERMSSEESLKALLKKIDFYILPMVNVDGGERMIRQTANGIDLNRDQVRLETPEAVALRSVINEFDPHLCIDFHEYQPLKSAYSIISSEILSVPWDVMFLTSGNPNVATPIRESLESLYLADVKVELDEKGHSSHTYYTPKKGSSGVVMNLAGTSPRSTANALSLNNAFTILTETRGIGIGRESIYRRIENVYTLACSFANTTFENSDKLRNAIDEAVNEKKPVAVSFSSEVIENYPLPFVNQIKNRIDTLELTVSNALNSSVKLSRELPASYLILQDQVKAIETLTQMGIEFTRLESDQEYEVESFLINRVEKEDQSFKNFTPVRVTTQVEKSKILFPKGTVLVPTTQKRSRLLSLMLEPESSNGFVNYRVIEAKEGDQLPVFRLMD
ncbi:MAG: M14 family zinc carboxypeptidase [Bacteroidales bacterium]